MVLGTSNIGLESVVLGTGNIVCEGEGVVEQAEFCHYSSLHRDKCGPPAILLLEEINISPGSGAGAERLCSCEFSGGRRTCLLGESVSSLSVLLPVLVSDPLTMSVT